MNITRSNVTVLGMTCGDRDAPVTRFDELHERQLHFIVLSRDLVRFHHRHPAMDATGHWTVDLPPLPTGSTPTNPRGH